MGFGRIAVLTLVAGCAAGLGHLMFSAGATIAALSYDARIFNLRQFSNVDDWATLVGGFLRAKANSNTVIVAGSSFSFGYPYPEELAFPYSVEPRALNVSVIGMPLESIIKTILCTMNSENLRVRKIILEVPLINQTSALVRAAEEGYKQVDCPNGAARSLLDYAVAHAYGLKWFTLLRDLYKMAADSTKISVVRVPNEYFATRDQFEAISPDLRALIEDAYEMAESVANDAYLFVTPVYLPAIAEAGHDPDNIRAQLEFAQRACVEIAGPRCILTDSMWEERSYYSNITHLNGTGGAYLGRLVTEAIR